MNGTTPQMPHAKPTQLAQAFDSEPERANPGYRTESLGTRTSTLGFKLYQLFFVNLD
jgi:hypothetical protein